MIPMLPSVVRRGRASNWKEVLALCHSAMSDSLWAHRLQPARPLCPWEFSRQEHRSGLPCPPPEDLPNPGIELRSPALQADSLLTEPPGKCLQHQIPSYSLLSPSTVNWYCGDKHGAFYINKWTEASTIPRPTFCGVFRNRKHWPKISTSSFLEETFSASSHRLLLTWARSTLSIRGST